ncbi:ubiquitin-like-conjugating enzyme ATG10 [Asparagus officinalis]|nr:ubiquitin-like-conjugating enzyme ATG10 [Asparagus officinalis]XP_020261900.1 ubiquitin-like-conjugating enzyme ATG10 [Asparagus officinalis]XP_020261901.1 ubiquitin-like-conjugating enzyme ATG10 [Asparagus officinalis]XP_020261902.1 ubiquitin-like-conjugating enzyme ATG10 [Asparagus officinalis]
MGSHKAWDGTLSSDDFYIAAKALCERWKEINSSLPQWTWIPSKREEGYLSLENVYHLDPNVDTTGEQGFSVEEEQEEQEEPADCATLVRCSHKDTHVYNFHIVYSFSYRVPVLYFRGYRCDGQPLDMHGGIKEDLDYSPSLLEEPKWTFMTQEEHPFLHCPWYMLHPCGTSEWMKLFLGPNQQDFVIFKYLASWLSVAGQAVGLRIPLNLHTEDVKKYASSINDGEVE